MNKLITRDMNKFYFFGKTFDKQKEAAEYYGVSYAYMSAVFLQKKPPTKAMLDDCGYEKVVTRKVEYVKKD